MNPFQSISELFESDPRLVKDMAARVKTGGSVLFPKDEVLTGDPGGQKAGYVLSPKNIAAIRETLSKIPVKNNAELVWEFLKLKYPMLTSIPSKMTTSEQTAFLDMFGQTRGAYDAEKKAGWIFNLFNKRPADELANTGIHETAHAFQDVIKGRGQEVMPPSKGGTYHLPSPNWTVFKPKDPDLRKVLQDQAFENYRNQPVEVQARAFGDVAQKTMQKFLDTIDPRQFLSTEDSAIPKWVMEGAGQKIRAFQRAKELLKFQTAHAAGKTGVSPERSIGVWDKYSGAMPFNEFNFRNTLGKYGDPEEAKILKAFLESAGFTDIKNYNDTIFLGGRTASQGKTVFPQWVDPK